MDYHNTSFKNLDYDVMLIKVMMMMMMMMMNFVIWYNASDYKDNDCIDDNYSSISDIDIGKNSVELLMILLLQINCYSCW